MEGMWFMEWWQYSGATVVNGNNISLDYSKTKYISTTKLKIHIWGNDLTKSKTKNPYFLFLKPILQQFLFATQQIGQHPCILSVDYALW